MFLCDRVRPADWPPGLRDAWADETARLCDDVLELRGQLGVDVEDCATARYLDAVARRMTSTIRTAAARAASRPGC
jgi:hypothetical protein